MKRFFGGVNNPWNAFQSAFAEQPFDIYAMTRRQVAMFYHTMKDHLVRHVDALTARPTGSLWDYVPEPRLHAAQPLINDVRVGVGHPNTGVVDPEEDTMQANEDRGNAEAALRCLGCGRFMHRDDVYPCMDCHATPFPIECLESHYTRFHPRPQQAEKEKEKAEEREVLRKDADEARSQWVDQMTNLTKISMPLSRRIASIASIVVALISVALTDEPFWATTSADSPVSLLQ